MKLVPKSWSHFETHDDCPLAYKFRYIDKVAFKKPEPMRFGGGFHEFRFRYFETCRETGRDSDWTAVKSIARSCFHDKDLPMERWEEFYELCRQYAENRPYNPKMGIEIKFGVDRSQHLVDFDEADYFRGILDGLEVNGDRGIITDAKTARSTALAFTQLRIYAAFMALLYPEVREWKLVYDFVRMNRLIEERVLTENLTEIRAHIRMKVEKMEATKKWKAQPGEHCLTCPFLSRCDYRIQGLEAVKTAEDAKAAMEDHWFLKAQAAQAKRMVKMYVNDFGEVKTKTLEADYFPSQSVDCDKRGLIRLLKVFKRNPVDYVEFPPKVLRKMMKDKEIADDAANFIFIEHKHKFGIKKIGKDQEEEEPEEGPVEL